MTENAKTPSQQETLAVAIMAGVLLVFAAVAYGASLLAQPLPILEAMLFGGAMILGITGGFALLVWAWRYLIHHRNPAEVSD